MRLNHENVLMDCYSIAIRERNTLPTNSGLFLRKLGVKQSYSYPGMPYDNAVAEFFFASMKVR